MFWCSTVSSNNSWSLKDVFSLHWENFSSCTTVVKFRWWDFHQRKPHCEFDAETRYALTAALAVLRSVSCVSAASSRRPWPSACCSRRGCCSRRRHWGRSTTCWAKTCTGTRRRRRDWAASGAEFSKRTAGSCVHPRHQGKVFLLAGPQWVHDHCCCGFMMERFGEPPHRTEQSVMGCVGVMLP